MTVDTRLSNLPMPPEPLDDQQRFALGLNKNQWLAKATLKQGGWLAPELWYLWKPWLEKEGVTVQGVQESVSDCSPYFFQWVQHELGWEQAISSVIKSIENHA